GPNAGGAAGRLMIARCTQTLMMAALAAIIALPSWSANLRVAADGAPLQHAIDQALSGDVVVLEPGEHKGPVIIDKTLTLQGEKGAALVGKGEGSVITVNEPGTVVRNLEIRGSGKDLFAMDSGIFVAQTAEGARIEDNAILDNLIGIYLHGAREALAKGNRIV